MNLPSPIRTFFEADGRKDGDVPIRAFAPDAIVKDEGRTHVGHAAIAAWWRAAKAENQHTSEPLTIDTRGDLATVRARVTGQFPGSPATLTFSFHIESDLIATLEIGA